MLLYSPSYDLTFYITKNTLLLHVYFWQIPDETTGDGHYVDKNEIDVVYN